MKQLSLLLLTLTIGACGDDPVSYSEPVGIRLSVASGDVEDGALLEEKNINTESGNPYGAFASAAHDALGADPGRIAVESATLELTAGSGGVAALAEIFADDCELSFVMNGSELVYPVATYTIPRDSGAGPLSLDVDFDSDVLTDVEYADLAGGSFKVVLRADAAAGFAELGGGADLLATFTFTAYE